MAYATLEQIDARLTQIDDLLFKARTGQISISKAERMKLENEADSILETLSNELGRLTEKGADSVREAKQKVRSLNFIAAAIARQLELHPEPNPKRDAMIAEAFAPGSSKSNEEVAQLIFGDIFVDEDAD